MTSEAKHSSLLVTGCYRSGTTLLEKLLHAHPRLCVASQPFPVLYFQVKAAFDDFISHAARYPLDHRFLEDAYEDDDFHVFLDAHLLSKEELDRLFEGLAAYTDGLWTPDILGFRDQIESGTFRDVYEQLIECIARLYAAEESTQIGTKEVLVEEYVPYLIRHGTRSILIIRDPRDMITSLNFGERDNLTGQDRPVLYSLRAWRKSVAIALAYEEHAHVRWLRYEDLVARTAELLSEIAGFLGIEPFPEEVLRGEIRDQQGRLWRGNSSFADHAGIAASSIGRFRKRLPESVVAYIETACLPEMRVLGYETTIVEEFEERHLLEYADPFEKVHAKFPADYSRDQKRVADEIERFGKLRGSDEMTEKAIRKWFLYDRAYRRLAAGVR